MLLEAVDDDKGKSEKDHEIKIVLACSSAVCYATTKLKENVPWSSING